MAEFVYPSALPRPKASGVTPAERRALSDPRRPRDARALQRDRLEFERLTWPPLTAAQAAVFRTWWRETLVYGGAWFSAKWPLPRGFVQAVRKFREQPRWEFLGRGYWRVTALCEVRGVGELPQEASGPLLSIGWLDPITSEFGAIAHANSGSGTFDLDLTSGYVGVVAFAGGTVVWSVQWTPVGADPTPTMSQPFGPTSPIGQLTWPNIGSFTTSEGLARVTATVNGAPTDAVIMAAGPGGYNTLAWGPEP